MYAYNVKVALEALLTLIKAFRRGDSEIDLDKLEALCKMEIDQIYDLEG